MKSTQIRTLWKSFWEDNERNHARAMPCSLVVSSDDPTTMFNTAGMQQFVPYLMGKEHPMGTRLYNIQGCVRTTDIDDVGDVSHLTFFEMMGNRSLDDYFKNESIARSRQFLTGKEWLGLDTNYLAVTVFEGDSSVPADHESAQLRQAIGVPTERITYLPASENWWGPAGATGPCGPDTEIYYWIGAGDPPKEFDFAKDEDNRLEIRNNVFMAYYKDDQGSYQPGEQQNVDTGMGLERLSMVMQCVSGAIDKPIREASVYDTDLFAPILKQIAQYVSTEKSQRIIADHLRTSFRLIYEGLAPSNEGRGYVLRRLIRRAYFQLYKSLSNPDMCTGTFHELLQHIVSELNVVYDNKFSAKDLAEIAHEASNFESTIAHGKQMLEGYLNQLPDGAMLGGDAMFKLYDTYGFPVELTTELASDAGYTVDISGFNEAMKAAQEKSRQGSKQMFAKDVERAAYIDELPPTQFIGYDQLTVDNVSLLKDFEVAGQRVLVFDKTPFYAESGGQTGDSGLVELPTGEQLRINDVQKYGGVRLHFVE